MRRLVTSTLLLALLVCSPLTQGVVGEDKEKEKKASLSLLGKGISLTCEPGRIEAFSVSLEAFEVKQLAAQLTVFRDGKAEVAGKYIAKWNSWPKDAKPIRGDFLVLYPKGKGEKEIFASLGGGFESARSQGTKAGEARGFQPPGKERFTTFPTSAPPASKTHLLYQKGFLDPKDASVKAYGDYEKAKTLDDWEAVSKKHKDSVFVVLTVSWE